MEGSRQDILKGLSLIQELAVLLRVSKECLATSNVYFQKYKVLCNEKTKSYHLAGACLFVACKTLEQGRHSELICRKMYQIRMSRKSKVLPNLQVPPMSPAMLSESKQKLFFHEFLLLNEIGFNVEVPLPFKKIQKLVDCLEINNNFKNNFLRLAFGFANDFFRTSVPLVKKVSRISEACVFLAGQRFRIDVGVVPDDEIIDVLKIAVKVDCTKNNK